MYGLYEAINVASRASMQNFNFCMSATVVNTDNLSKGTIDVLPIVGYTDSTQKETLHSVIHNVPIIFPSTNTSSFTIPVNKGDGVLLIFTQSNQKDYLNGVKTQHVPTWSKWLSLENAIAIIGFNPNSESSFNQNNFTNPLDMGNVNIVHNKKTDNEVVFTLTSDGKVNVIAPQKVNVYTQTAEVKADKVILDTPSVDCKNAIVETKGDVKVRGLSVYNHMTEHDHNYTDDGNLMITAKPNNKNKD